jgi:glycosyltransferase involved in cell wall biosynthesis
MKTGNERADIIFLGRYNESEILSGPEKTAKRIFNEHSKQNKSCFIQYFFDGRKYSLYKKLFGKEKVAGINNSEVLTLGLFCTFKALFNIKPKIIHIITFERFAVTAFLYRLFGKTKIIYSSHGIVTHENNVIKKITGFHKFKDKICEKIFLRYPDKIIFNSEIPLDIAETYFKINEYKAVILAHGIDGIFSQSYKNRLKSDSGTLKLVILQQSVLNKSSAEFLNKCLDKINCNIEIFSIGNEFILETANPKINIKYIDKMSSPELAEFYRDKDLFLSLNKYDTFSISAIEAMAAGLVPVITEETGMSRYIIYGENGFTVKYGDSDKLAELIEYLNSDRILINEISQTAANIYDLLSWGQVYETYNNIYLTTLK